MSVVQVKIQQQKISGRGNTSTHGFTLVELIVSMALFIIVVFITTSAFLNITHLYKKASTTRAAMDNLNLSIESMIRSIRTGHHYRCSNTPIYDNSSFFPRGDVTPMNCPGPSGGRSLLFTTSETSDNNSNYWFRIGETSNNNRVQYRTGNLSGYITAKEIYISNAKFYVTGAESTDNNQPRVNIVIQGYTLSDPDKTKFSVYTSVTQRSPK